MIIPSQTMSNNLNWTCCPEILAGIVDGCSGGMRISIRDAQIATDRVLAYLVDNDLFWNVRSREVEEDRLVHGAILLFELPVFDRHGGVELAALFVDTLQFDGNIAYLLRLVPADDGEFHVIPFTEAAELVNFIMVARDERAHLAASHFQVFPVRCQVCLDADNLGVHGLDIIAGSLGSEFRVDRSIQSCQLLSRRVVEF